MSATEQAVRDAAALLHDAIVEARASGLFVQWPNRADDLPAIAISETGKGSVVVTVNPRDIDPATVEKAGIAAQRAADEVILSSRTQGLVDEASLASTVTNLDGSPIERDADGAIHGQPLDITDEERAALPPLDPAASNDPSNFVVGELGAELPKKRK